MNFATTTDALPHQKDAIAKQAGTRVGALFMEMGTGKSRAAIGLAQYRRNRIDRVVWFCPVSLRETVAAEIRKHTTAQPADVYVFDDRTQPCRIPGTAEWVVVGIESMSASSRLKLSAAAVITPKSMVIVDESTHIKGHRAARTCWITDIAKRARYRLILTGTPLTQGFVDLFAQMRFLSPRILGYNSFYAFSRNHLEYSDRYPGMIVRTLHTEWLAAKVQPYVYQVTKENCLDLPRKLYDRRVFRLTPEQEAEYEHEKLRILERAERSATMETCEIFRLFTALQQVASGYVRRFDKSVGKWTTVPLPHLRCATAMSVVAALPDDEKVILWAKFRYDVEQLCKALRAAYGESAVEEYHGGIRPNARNMAVERWRVPEGARFLVATPGTAGHGLTLTEARYVVFYNNSFKYSERVQAEDRAHRIGQTRAVTYIDLVADCGIDERIEQAIAEKANVLQRFRAQVDCVKDKGKLRKLIRSL